MIYPKASAAELSPELFKKPTNEYRGAPFWAWNNRLDADQLMRQLDYFTEMGIGGFHMHCRTGMGTEYMGDEFLSVVEQVVARAKEKGMKAYLYDEDRWPSGFAGGLVTKDKKYRSRYLILSPQDGGEINAENGSASTMRVGGRDRRRGADEKPLARYEITLLDGCLDSYRRLSDGESGENIWCLFFETAAESPWYNNQTYVDTLNMEATKRFIELTHEKYYKRLGGEFGGVIPAIFTDEPQFPHKTTLGFAGDKSDIILPYTDGFDRYYAELCGGDFLAILPELIWELPGGRKSKARYDYHNVLAELFAVSFADTVGEWCGEHGIMLTGHMMEEPSLHSQTAALGEAMRSYRSFHLPGIDMLCDRREYTTAKQAQSATHQFGREGVLSELYGVTSWGFDFRGHKLQGDWQAALGVTNRVHHLAWVSMEGEAKRDYPASIFYQSPWYKEYGYIEDHFARVGTALTRGRPQVRIGVIHPVESYWMCFGSSEQTAAEREELEQSFDNITNWLLFSQLDFDFISESLLPEQFGGAAGGRLKAGEMEYEAVVVPNLKTIRSSTLSALEGFADEGGTVIFAGELPCYIDGAEDSAGRCKQLAGRCTAISFNRAGIISALEPYRDIDIRRQDGRREDRLLYQMRNDGGDRWLFVARGTPMENVDIPRGEKLRITVRGEWMAKLYDTMTGDIEDLPVGYSGGNTVISRELYEHDSLLVRLSPGRDKGCMALGPTASYTRAAVLSGPVDYKLSEPNVLLLDQAEYRFDRGGWHEQEELLRIDNEFRRQLGWPLRSDAVAQPWTIPAADDGEQHMLELRFTIDSEVNVRQPELAVENPEQIRVFLNGEPVEINSEPSITGWFVDESIKRITLPDIKKGVNTLRLIVPFTRRSNIEWCYILGQFGVRAQGSRAWITRLPQRISFGDYANMGFPFYAGSMTYICDVLIDRAGEYVLEASKYRAPLIGVSVDGRDTGRIAFSPYRLEPRRLDRGRHEIKLTSFGNRSAAFGPLHNCDEKELWHGPNIWRTEGAAFSYEYQLSRMGILKAPELLLKL